MSPLATLRQPSLPGHFSSDCCSTHCRGRQAWWGSGVGVGVGVGGGGVLVSWIAAGETAVQQRRERDSAVILVSSCLLVGLLYIT